ncbi:zinc finger BED domain-containing protein RICESLEEPER 2-like [Oryza sativa Japonica Group]|nr:zinc finger BED domain-containing protein RICESLEEPER 2-like [Oryza sativa Japonica Group]XP_025876015.1 zinc finger BED domain-containing protein RICESLEEPER 2-like [Oryza sativa Japonica Group]XP_025876016.1 zinc finger BED domain-containing protein RICESLEEPER 2-like [Oryza sativa Japonica Group]
MLIMPITWMNKRKSSGSAPSPLFLGTRPKRLRSKVWDDFKPIYIDGKVARAECMHCHQILISNSANGTSNLLKHQAKCSPHPQKRPMQQKLPFLLSSQKSLTAPNSDPTQKKLPFLPISQKKCSGPADAMPQKKDPALPNSMNDTNWKSQEVGKSGSPEELATPEQKNLALPDVPTNNNRKDQPHDENLVPKQKCNPTVVNLKNPEVDQSGSNGLIQTMAMCGYLPMMMYNNRFRKCVPCLNSMLPMPSNDSMFGDFMQLFHNEKAKLKEKFSTLSSRVCLSAHVWHHDPLSAYLCLSVHYIDNEWERQQKIIRFRQVDPSCNARELSDVILRAIEDWGLRDKVFSITLDDEFADDSVASNVKDHLQKWNSHYSNQSLFVVRYGTYLLDQVIQVGLDELDKSMEKSMKCSKFTEGFTSSAVRKANHNYAESAKDWSNARPICDTLESFHQYMDTMHDFPRPRHLFDKVWAVKCDLQRKVDIYKDGAFSTVLKKMQQKFEKCWKLCCFHFYMAMAVDPSYRLEHINFHVSLYRDIDYIRYMHDIFLNLFDE